VPLKIALIDNMNNNFYALARYLRDIGHSVTLYLVEDKNMVHFYPVADVCYSSGDNAWIKAFPFSYGKLNFLKNFFPNKMFDEFYGYDKIIACGLSPAFLLQKRINVDIFIPYGADMYGPVSWEYRGLPTFRKLLTFVLYAYQKKAIKKAKAVIFNTSHLVYKIAADKLGINAINLPIPMLYCECNDVYCDTSWDILSKKDFIVFNHSRQLWLSNPDNLCDFEENLGNKRNDKTIRAFARFVNQTRFKSPTLVLFEYGQDVDASKSLVLMLNIERYVIWMPKSDRKFIMQGLPLASLAVDQLREGISGIGGATYEIMACGIPCITHTNGATSVELHPFYGAPIVEALTEDDLLYIMEDYELNPDKYKSIGDNAKRWFKDNLGIGLIRQYDKFLQTKESLCAE
jgi:glycosyltransferase involved in cell wall biosynthesis